MFHLWREIESDMAQSVIVMETANVRVRPSQLTYSRDGLFCALLLAICFLIPNPFVNMGLIDDWSYIRTAQIFAQTGHLVYNGWATASLGWQVVWGALFIKLLGFSFVAVRLSILPIALASVYLLHQILIRFGIERGYAVFGTLTVALSPIFLQLTDTYMTDIPGMFCMLLCLYLCQRALATTTDGRVFAWLLLATVTNLVGGTARQTIWLGALVMVPSTLWMFRRRRALFWSGMLLWVVSAVIVFLCMRWFNRQPYFLPETLFPRGLSFRDFFFLALREVVIGIKWFLCLNLLVLPVLAAWWPLALSVPRRLLVRWLTITSALVSAGIIFGLKQGIPVDKWTAPWFTHVLSSLRDAYLGMIPGPIPYIFQPWQRIIATVLVVATMSVFFLHLFNRPPWKSRTSATNGTSWAPVLWLLMPYSLSVRGGTRPERNGGRDLRSLLTSLYRLSLLSFLLCYYQDVMPPNRRHLRLSFGLQLVSCHKPIDLGRDDCVWHCRRP